jgi:hypothetical protein
MSSGGGPDPLDPPPIYATACGQKDTMRAGHGTSHGDFDLLDVVCVQPQVAALSRSCHYQQSNFTENDCRRLGAHSSDRDGHHRIR